MKQRRRQISSIAGEIEKRTTKIFRGVFTPDTIHMARNTFDLNTPNLFFINIDNFFIAIFITASKCIVVDGVTMKSFPEEIRGFINDIRGETPITKLPFKMIDRETSMIFCLLFGVALAKHTNLADIIKSFNFRANAISRNCEIVNAWFNTRYR